MHTINTLKITLGQVQERIDLADKTVRESAASILRRSQRNGPAPVALLDMPVIPLPEVDALPVALFKVAQHRHLSAQDRDSREYKCHVGYRRSLNVVLREEATPEELVAAIKAADERAALYVALDAKYTEDTKAAIAEHVKAQHGACVELLALCAQTGETL